MVMVDEELFIGQMDFDIHHSMNNLGFGFISSLINLTSFLAV